jgi:plasmid stability protein
MTAVTSRDVARSIEATARDIQTAMLTYQRCPLGGRVRQDLILSIDQLHERLSHQIMILVRKNREER